MTKSTTTYLNTLATENQDRWTPLEGLEGMAEELTLSIDPITGEYTKLTRFLPGTDTSSFGGGENASLPRRSFHRQRPLIRPGV